MKFNKILTILIITGFVSAIFFIHQILIAKAELSNTTTNNQNQTTPEIDELNRSIQAKKNSIDALKSREEEYRRILRQKQSEKSDLENQLAIFDNRIAAMEINIEDVKENIAKTELEIRKIDLEITLKNKEIEKNKEQIGNALGLLYQEGSKSDLEVMLLNDNLSTYIDQVEHLKNINTGIQENLENLKNTKERLNQDKKDMDIKRLSLVKLNEDLLDKMDALQEEKQGKVVILDETKQSESEYQSLLAKARKEQQDAAADITSLEKRMRDKMSANTKFKNLDESSGDLIWPVPKNRINAYFHDPDYPFRNVFEHPAIDIRAAQGTSVRASASGYIARAKLGTNGSYGYIMIVHANGLSTVYGHVSSIAVEEEQFVNQGQIIGKSGGTPGTDGAGNMTTGPHMHFEVRLNGIPVDPLEYLK